MTIQQKRKSLVSIGKRRLLENRHRWPTVPLGFVDDIVRAFDDSKVIEILALNEKPRPARPRPAVESRASRPG